jgi:hypothetical protein
VIGVNGHLGKSAFVVVQIQTFQSAVIFLQLLLIVLEMKVLNAKISVKRLSHQMTYAA